MACRRPFPSAWSALSAATMLLAVTVVHGRAGAEGRPRAGIRPPARAAGCLSCHGDRETVHVRQWESSLHARAGVGCADCHGGDPAQAAVLPGHGVAARGRTSTACEGCHRAVAAAWRGSRHAGEVAAGHPAPHCIDCHGWMGGLLLTGDALQERCASCHHDGGGAGSGWVPARARSVLDLLARVGLSRALLSERVARLGKEGADVRQAEADLKAVAAEFQGVAVEWHRFSLHDVEARGQTALERLEEVQRGLGD